MNNTQNIYNVGIGNFIVKLESFLIKNLIILLKFIRRRICYLLHKINNILKLAFSIENRFKSISGLIIVFALIKMLIALKNFLLYIKNKDTDRSEEEKGLLIVSVNLQNNNSSDLNEYDDKNLIHAVLDNHGKNNKHNETNEKLIITYIKDKEYDRIKKKIYNDNLKKILHSIENQNACRKKHNLPKERFNSAFYNILKLYMKENLNNNSAIFNNKNDI